VSQWLMSEAVASATAYMPFEPERRSQSRAASAGTHSVRTLDGVPARRLSAVASRYPIYSVSINKIANFPINRATQEFRGAESGADARALARARKRGRNLDVIQKSSRVGNMVAELRGLGRRTLFDDGAFGMKPERNIFEVDESYTMCIL